MTDRRTFMLYSSMIGLTLPYLPKKEVAKCKRRWDKIGEITIQRVEIIIGKIVNDENGYITDASYFPYEEYIQDLKDNREEWTYKCYKTEKAWLKAEHRVGDEEEDFHFRVFENGLNIGRLDFGVSSIQFYSLVLDEIIALKDWWDDVDYEALFADPLETAKSAVRLFRKKAKKSLMAIIDYYNLKELPK